MTESTKRSSFLLWESYQHKLSADFHLPVLYLLFGECHIRVCCQNTLHSSPTGEKTNLWQMLQHHAVFKDQYINIINVFCSFMVLPITTFLFKWTDTDCLLQVLKRVFNVVLTYFFMVDIQWKNNSNKKKHGKCPRFCVSTDF